MQRKPSMIWPCARFDGERDATMWRGDDRTLSTRGGIYTQTSSRTLRRTPRLPEAGGSAGAQVSLKKKKKAH